MFNRLSKTLVTIMCLCLFGLPAAAAEVSSQGSINLGAYRIQYSVIPSTFVPVETARQHQLKRSKYESLLNITVTPHNAYQGLPAKVSGFLVNLMQQKTALNFIEIKEQHTVYYLAPVRVSGEEIVHFTVEALVEGESTPLQAKFSSRLISK